MILDLLMISVVSHQTVQAILKVRERPLSSLSCHHLLIVMTGHTEEVAGRHSPGSPHIFPVRSLS